MTSEQKFVAEVLNDDGTIYDHCYNWETGQNYALSEGRKVRAIADDGHMTIEDAQRLYDSELAIFLDCFGD